MVNVNFILLFVDNPLVSASFYEALFSLKPIEASPTFAMFAMPSGLKLGLWSRHTVEPAPGGSPGSGEIAIALQSSAAVEDAYGDWRRRGLTIIQPPTEMDFGRTFVATDPDGHRIRVFCPNRS